MDCKETEKRIPDFINREMDYKTLRKFREHIESCPSCKEELVISFLVTEGMIRLEEGSTFDLNKELNRRMYEAERIGRTYNRFVYTGILLELLAMLIMGGALLWMLL